MSLTLSTISARSAGFAPIPLEIQGTRMNAYIDPFTITAIAEGAGDYAGRVKLTVSTMTYFDADDCITIAGATGTKAYLNGRHNVYAIDVPNKYVYLYTSYVAVAAGNNGTIQRTNGIVKFKTTISINSAVVATFYSYPTLDDEEIPTANVDLSVFIQPYFASDFRLTAGVYTDTATKAMITYSVSVYEMHQKDDYTFFMSSATTQTGLLAHRSTKISDRILNDATVNEDQWLTDMKTVIYPVGEKIILHGICTVSSGWIRIEDTTVGSTVTYVEVATVRNDGVIFVYAPVPVVEGGVYPTFNICMQNDDAEEGLTWQSEKIYFKPDSKCYPYDKTLYFLNRYGGWDLYQFRDVTKKEFKVDKIRNRTFQQVQGTSNETKLQGRPETFASLEILKDIISSPEVYDTAGARVYVKDANFIIKDGDQVIIPEITIEEFEDLYING